MRPLCTLDELRLLGVTRAARDNHWLRITQGVYGDGKRPPTVLDRCVAEALAADGVSSGRVAAAMLGLDGVSLWKPDFIVPPGSSNRRPGARRRTIADSDIIKVEGYRCTGGLLTLLDLAYDLDDLTWEQALESALRKKLVTLDEVIAAVDGSRGADRMRRVLALRPLGAPPTGSVLETLFIQMARRVEGLPPPERQVEVRNRHGDFVAFCDTAWTDLGAFNELDGQQHKDQPVYDASRETSVVEATGWLCGRFTWHEVVNLPVRTARKLAGVIDQARRRPLPTR